MQLDNLNVTPNSSRTLKWWVLLPQITTYSDGEKIPAIIGNLKTITIPIIMVILTIVLEGALIYELNNEGVNFITLLGLSIFDFVIAFLPIILLLSFNLIPSKKHAELYLITMKLKYLDLETVNRRGKENERVDLQQNLKKIKKALIQIIFTEVVCMFTILGFAFWKFLTYYNVFGEEFLVMPVGRFTIIVIIISTLTHIFFTKTLISYIICNASLSKEISQRHHFTKEVVYQEAEINYDIDYRPAKSRGERHFIGQKVEKTIVEQGTKEGFIGVPIHKSSNNQSNLEASTNEANLSYYRTSNFIGNQNICLVYQDYIKDPEITDLYINQKTREARETIISLTKEKQNAYV